MRAFRILLIAVLGVVAGPNAVHASDSRLLIFAAASLTEAVTQIAAEFEAQTGKAVVVSFAGTQQLVRQIDAGAPAALLISADRKWMDWAAGRGLLAEAPPRAFAGNRLVIAVRNETEDFADVEGLLTKSRFAMADPLSVPAGRYAKQALEASGWWENAQGMAVYGENVRIALKRVALGEVSAAIVYATDAAAEPDVRALMTFDEKLHAPIVYLAAATKEAPKAAERFLDFLVSENSQAILKKAGFAAAPEAR